VLILGKLLETIGSGLIALVAAQAFILEAFVGRHLVPKQIDRQEGAGTDDVRLGEREGTDDVKRVDIKTVGEHLEAVYSLRRRQFGFREALAVAIGDSTHIIAALEERYPEPPLYPGDAAARQRALALEDYFDEQLGPALRAAIVTPLFRHDPDLALRVLTTGMPDKAYQRLRPLVRIFPAFYRFRHKISDARLEADRATVNAALDWMEQERQGRAYLVGDAFTVADFTAAAMLGALLQPPEIQYPLRVELPRARLPRHAPTASGHAVGGRHLPAAARPLRGSLATVGCRVDAVASVSEPVLARGGQAERGRSPVSLAREVLANQVSPNCQRRRPATRRTPFPVSCRCGGLTQAGTTVTDVLALHSTPPRRSVIGGGKAEIFCSVWPPLALSFIAHLEFSLLAFVGVTGTLAH
jgi:glutathione S-transferase